MKEFSMVLAQCSFICYSLSRDSEVACLVFESSCHLLLFSS